MARILLMTTTGTHTPVVLTDLGNRSFTHPTTNYNLMSEFTLEELRLSGDLQTAITLGYITCINEDAINITNIDAQLSYITYSSNVNANINGNQQLSWSPDPTNFSTPDYGPFLKDISGNLMTRSEVLTDCFSMRDDFSGSSLTTPLTGTVTFTNGSTTVTGSSTSFLSEVSLVKYVKLSTHNDLVWAGISNVDSDVSLELDAPYTGATGTGTGVWSKWIPSVVTGGSVTVASSKLVLTNTNANGAISKIFRFGDYLPFTLSFNSSISNRRANQTFHMGFEDTTEDNAAEIVFDGTVNTVIKLQTSNDASELETNTYSLPGGLITSNFIDYRIEVLFDKVILYANNMYVGENTLHLPDPYKRMGMYFGLKNIAGTTGTTTATIDAMAFSNFNNIQVSSTTKGDPISIRFSEDIHTLSGYLSTSSTTTDQVILSYSVPTGTSFWLVGYYIGNGETTIRGNPVKIGRTPITTETTSPGSVDGNVFRSFNMAASTYRENDFTIPRRVGNAGDTIVMTVTPTGTTATLWHGTLDFVLR